MMKPLNKTALVYAVDLLAVRPYSTKQLAFKLKRRGYLEADIEAALQRLHDRHYLDDTDLCQRQCAAYLTEARRSLKAIRYKLMEKGFDSEDIENAFAGNSIDNDAYETAVCRKLLQGHFKPSSTDRQKAQAYLYRKGFSASAIRLAVDDFIL